MENNNKKGSEFKSYQPKGLEHHGIKKTGTKQAQQLVQYIKEWIEGSKSHK